MQLLKKLQILLLLSPGLMPMHAQDIDHIPAGYYRITEAYRLGGSTPEVLTEMYTAKEGVILLAWDRKEIGLFLWKADSTVMIGTLSPGVERNPGYPCRMCEFFVFKGKTSWGKDVEKEYKLFIEPIETSLGLYGTWYSYFNFETSPGVVLQFVGRFFLDDIH